MPRAFLLAVVVGASVMLAPAFPAHAQVSAECWAHLAGVKKSNTPAADRRYHLERGEFSPCTEQDAADNSGGSSNGSSSNSDRRHDDSNSSDSGDDGSSRYCRKHFYC
jgi:hypothetical protein